MLLTYSCNPYRSPEILSLRYLQMRKLTLKKPDAQQGVLQAWVESLLLLHVAVNVLVLSRKQPPIYILNKDRHLTIRWKSINLQTWEPGTKKM